MLLLLLLLFALTFCSSPFGHLVRQVHCSTYDMVIAWFIPYHFNCFNDSIDRFNQSNGTKFNNNPFDLSIMISVTFQCIFLFASLRGPLLMEFFFQKYFCIEYAKKEREQYSFHFFFFFDITVHIPNNLLLFGTINLK